MSPWADAVQLGNRRHEGFQQIAVLFKADLGDPLPRGGGPAAVSIGEVLLLERFVLEDVEVAE